MNILKIEDLTVEIEGKEILKQLNLELEEGKLHILLGLNGAGKSSLFNAIMGHPDYNITSRKNNI